MQNHITLIRANTVQHKLPTKIKVNLNGEVSRRKIVQNGLPQGSVLSPTVFNLYTADISETKSRKFMYVDDIGLVAQGNSFEQLEDPLNEDLKHFLSYFAN